MLYLAYYIASSKFNISEAEQTLLSEHEAFVKLQHEHDNMKSAFSRTHTKIVQSLEAEFGKRWNEAVTKHQLELKQLSERLDVVVRERDSYAKQIHEHKSTDDWFRDGRSVSPVRTHANTEVFSIAKEVDTVRTDSSYESCASRLSKAITKYDSQHLQTPKQRPDLMLKHHHFHHDHFR